MCKMTVESSESTQSTQSFQPFLDELERLNVEYKIDTNKPMPPNRVSSADCAAAYFTSASP